MKVRISGNAFAVMLASGIEVYKKEAFGYLIGKRHDNNLIITNAVPSQSAERRFTSVLPTDETRQLYDVLSRLDANGSRVIGDYHTHTDWGTEKPLAVFSKADISEMRDSNSLVYIIIAMGDKKRAWPRHYRCNGELVGSFDKYWFEIAAYYRRGGEQFNKGQIVCPSAILRKF